MKSAALLVLAAAASAGGQTAEKPVRIHVFGAEGATYFALETSAPLSPEGLDPLTVRASCLECPAVFVHPIPGDDGGAVVVGRFFGLAPETVRVTLTWGIEGTDAPRVILLTAGLRGAPVRNSLEETWREAAADHFDRLSRLPGPHADLCRYVHARMRREWKVPAPAAWDRRRGAEGSKRLLGDPVWFGFAEGAAAIERRWSSPWADLDLSDAGSVDGGRDAAKVHRPETLAPPKPARGPDAEELPPPGRADPGRLVPADFWMLRFGSRRAATRFAGLWAATVPSVENWFGPGVVSAEPVDLLTGSFVLDLNQLNLGAVGDPTLAGSDLRFAGGADLTLLLPVTNAAAFDAAASQIGGTAVPGQSDPTILRHVSADGTRVLYSARLAAGAFWALGYSPAAIRRMAAVLERPDESLAADAGYRGRGPPGLEDGLLYLSDDFLRAVTGPRRVIGFLRREACLSAQRRMRYEQFWRQFRDGRFADGVEELAAGGPAVCPHGGRYRLSADRCVVCPVHGRLENPVPVADLPDDLLTEAEVRVWRQASERLRDWIRPGSSAAVRIATVPSLSLECDLPAPMRRDGLLSVLDALLVPPAADGKPPVRRAIGPRPTVRLPAAAGMPDAVLTAAMALTVGRGADGEPLEFPAVLESSDPPIVPGPGPGGLLGAGRWRIWVGPLSGEQVARVSAGLNGKTSAPADASAPAVVGELRKTLATDRPAAYGLVRGRLVLASEPGLVDEAVKAPAAEPDPDRPELEGHLAAAIRIGAKRSEDRLERLEQWADAAGNWLCAGRQAGADAVGRTAGGDPATLAGWLRRVAGYEPDCPLAGRYALGPADCRCPHHGTLNARLQAFGGVAKLTALLPAPWRTVELAAALKPEGWGLTVRLAGELPATPPPAPRPAGSIPAARLLLEQASQYRLDGRETAGIEELRSLLWAFPRGPEAVEARRLIAGFRETQGRPALESLRERVRAGALDVEQVRPELEGFIEEYDGTPSAADARRELARLSRRSSGEYVWVAEAAAARGDFAQAVRLLESMRRRHPSDDSAAEAAEYCIRGWSTRRAEGEWAALLERIDREALVPPESLPLVRDFLKRFPAAAQAEAAAKLERTLRAATPADLLARARVSATLERWAKAMTIVEKLERFHPGAPEVEQGRRLAAGWLLKRTDAALAALRRERAAGRVDLAESRARLDRMAADAAGDAQRERIAAERARLDEEEAAGMLAAAGAAAAAGKPLEAVDIAGRILNAFGRSPSAAAARTRRLEWWQKWAEPSLKDAAAAAAAGRSGRALEILETLAGLGRFPEAATLIAETRVKLVGSDEAVAAYRQAMEIVSNPGSPEEAVAAALARLAEAHPGDPVGRQAAAELADYRKRDVGKLLSRAREAFAAGDRAGAGTLIARIRADYATDPAAKGAEELAAALADAEAAVIAGHLAAERVNTAYRYLTETVKKNPGLGQARFDALERSTYRLGKILLLQVNLAESGPAKVRTELQGYLDDQPAGPLRAVAAEWAERWQYSVRR